MWRRMWRWMRRTVKALLKTLSRGSESTDARAAAGVGARRASRARGRAWCMLYGAQYFVLCQVLCSTVHNTRLCRDSLRGPRSSSFFLVLRRIRSFILLMSSSDVLLCICSVGSFLRRRPLVVGGPRSVVRGQAQYVLGGSPPRSLILMIVDERHVAATPLPYTHTQN